VERLGPDGEIFDTVEFSYRWLQSRLRELAFLNAGVRITLTDERDANVAIFQYTGGLTEFVDYLTESKPLLHPAVIWIKRSDPQFEGQTKTKLASSEVRGIVKSAMPEGLSTYFEEHPDTAEAIVGNAVEATKARRAAQKAEEVTRGFSALSSTARTYHRQDTTRSAA
jgi:DNA gyrase/topoisomerase IV subunit B